MIYHVPKLVPKTNAVGSMSGFAESGHGWANHSPSETGGPRARDGACIQRNQTHPCLARRLVAVRRRAIFVEPEG
jgi:hypothetical protein